MLTSRLFLDTRRATKNNLYPLYIVVTKDRHHCYYSLGIKLSEGQWRNGMVVDHPQKEVYNTMISVKKADFDRAIMELGYKGAFAAKTAAECMQLIKDYISPVHEAELLKKEITGHMFVPYYQTFAASKIKPGTRNIYGGTLKTIKAYCDSIDTDVDTLTFEEINKTWLVFFERFCLNTMQPNTVSIHMRNIRAAFNAALDDELITNYPFRKFHIKHVITQDKSYDAAELRQLFTYQSEVPGENEAIDIYKLMFLLIGINSVDLMNLGQPIKGRVEYIRAKTGKPYSVKLEPEALEVIKRYAGRNHLLNCIERVPNYKTYFNRLGKSIRKAGLVQRPGMKSEGKALFPKMNAGAMRTSWATIAQEELDIPRDTIAAALGHSTVDVTSTYLRTNWAKKIDVANRKVIDWVLYGKKSD